MDINEKALNYLKAITAETISNAKSGHTGTALGASSIIYALFKDHLMFNPKDPTFINRDRFVLSAGHASAMLYTSLYMFGYNISKEDLQSFRKYGSKTAGHPEYNPTLGIETTTGPLGQGVANAVGLALAESIFEAKLSSKKCPLINNYTYVLAGDGCLMEGVAVEACSLAGTLNLNKLILLYDDNNITIDGARTITNSEDTAKKFEAMGWNYIIVKNGNDYISCTKAISKAKTSNKPTIIIFKTQIGIGTTKAGTNKVHAYPLPEDELKLFKESLGIDSSFYIPEDVKEYFNQTQIKNEKVCKNWCEMLKALKTEEPEKFKDFHNTFSNKKVNYGKIVKVLADYPELAGRDISSLVLNEIAKAIPNLVGGTADVGPSTKAVISNGGEISNINKNARNIHFGIREHAMGAICNGLALYAKTPVFDSTFMAFSNYMLPPLRLRAMMKLPVLSIFTHDSIDIGEDGPTHQPIEQLASLRQIVGLNVFRPASEAEIIAAYKFFVETNEPTAIVVTKSILKKQNTNIEDAEKGGYIAFETANPKIEIISTGKEVELAIDVAKSLSNTIGVRVISIPNEKLFDSQDKAYKNKIRLKNAEVKIAIEASGDPIWYKYVGTDGLLVNVNNYQYSGKGSEVYKKAGFNAEHIISLIKKALK